VTDIRTNTAGIVRLLPQARRRSSTAVPRGSSELAGFGGLDLSRPISYAAI